MDNGRYYSAARITNLILILQQILILQSGNKEVLHVPQHSGLAPVVVCPQVELTCAGLQDARATVLLPSHPCARNTWPSEKSHTPHLCLGSLGR